MEDDDWQQHCAEFEELLSQHRGRSLPPGASDLHFALMRARMRARQAEISKIFAEAKKDPVVWARINRPL